ncbi:UNVERIFIED_CONTAM: putative mitochondrial protein [Sesamum radiatum]|uniref:Mitochondrial protein n=1 Tax=Sesamum radiatum TaxID=300843 RepID=A0AAW2JD33_SESRA
METLKRRLNLFGVCVSPIGRSGGLVLMWQKSVEVQLQSFSHWHIDASVRLEDSGEWWRFTGIYGEPDTTKRVEFWKLLVQLHSQSARPWLCAGDFNEILEHSEKEGGSTRAEWKIRNFRNCLTQCGLHDLGFQGSGSAAGANRLGQKLETLGAHLLSWGRHLGRGTKDRILALEKSLVNLQTSTLTEEVKARELNDRAELSKLITQEEIFWKQRSKDLWLKEGDRNTRFFHAKASHRYHTNSIRRLQCSDGSWTDSVDGIRQCIVDYFDKVFTSTRPLSDDILRGTEHLPVVVDNAMVDDLQRPFTEIECKQPQSLTQYRPISLCNVIYKIASKAIANRLKPWLDRIISPAQSAFVPGRLITDNVLLAFETNHFLHTHSKGRKRFMNLKLDISKAYDRVEWSFLRRVLGKLGFPCSFIDLIILCVSSVSYSFVLSGSRFGSITPQRGLRQGDPLSPYLFLLCTESLSSLFRVASAQGLVPGVAVCRVQHVRGILDTYKLASGQEINLCKSSATFSRNTPVVLQQQLADLLGIRLENKHELYLGLPAMAFRSKKALFAALKDRIWRRIHGWHERTLSQAGKAVLIQAVVQAIPAYAMSCFHLPRSLLQQFQSLAADFFWHDGERRRIHWLAWDKLSLSKVEGGLGLSKS